MNLNIYESEKKKIKEDTTLTPKEYENKIKELARKLRI